MLILYVFGMIFAQIASEYLGQQIAANGQQDPEIRRYWGSVPRAMYTLYKCVTGGVDWENVVNELSKISSFWVFIFNVYLAFTVFAVLNVVIGVFCQSAVESAAHDYENIINVKIREKTDFLKKVRMLFNEIDESGDGNITYEELQEHLQQDHVKAYFEHLGLDPEDSWDLFKIIDDDGSSEITMDEFTSGCMRLKGPAKVIDIEKIAYDRRIWEAQINKFMADTDKILLKIHSVANRTVEMASKSTMKAVSTFSTGSNRSEELMRQNTGSPRSQTRVAVYI